MNTKTLQDAYITMQEASGIKVGDTVRVLRKAGDEEMGWGAVWTSSYMDKYVGETGVVEECDGSDGLSVRFSNRELWYFPFFVLEKIADAPRYITINGLEVPEPVREPLKMGEKYWRVAIELSCVCLAHTWACDAIDRLWLQRGFIHRTQEAAEKHSQALLSFTEMGEAKS